MSQETSFVLVPGSWHQPAAFKPTVDILEEKGYKTRGVTLASVGKSTPRGLVEQDATRIRESIQAELDQGREVVVVCHSYGSVPMSEALKSFANVSDRGKGGIKRLVYMTSFVLSEGGSLMKALNMQDLPWFDVEGDVVHPKDPKTIFYNDLSDAEAQPYIDALEPFSYRAWYHELTFAPYKHFPSTYIVCTDDNAVPLPAQEGMIAGARAATPNAFDVVERCDASHSPFISQPGKMAEFLVKAAGGGQ